MVVDITLARGGRTTGPSRLLSYEAHRRAVETLTEALRPYRNWSFNLANKRNIRDERYVSHQQLRSLRHRLRQIDPKRLVTASHAGEISPADLREYLQTVRLSFLAPQRSRRLGSSGSSGQSTPQYLADMREIGRVIPVFYLEPFRRGIGRREPAAADYLEAARAARDHHAAGWCFHNGDQRGTPDGQPRRCYDLREKRLFDQFDQVELEALELLSQEFP